MKIRNNVGMSMLPILVGLTILAAISSFFTQMGTNITKSQKFSEGRNDRKKLTNLVNMILGNPNYCAATFKDLRFYKSNVDRTTTGLYIPHLYISKQNGVRSIAKLSSVTSSLRKFGILSITSMKLIMNNGQGFNYATNPKHFDRGLLKISGSRIMTSELRTPFELNFYIFVEMETGSSGRSRILGCQKSAIGSDLYLAGCEKADYWRCACAYKPNGTSRIQVTGCVHCNSNWEVDSLWLGNINTAGWPQTTDCNDAPNPNPYSTDVKDFPNNRKIRY